uniref:t-SNARE coiled-coil homology domain-containing protein n=1 Tax=Spongospora subterranea TaxID=70186 RepID=A0A0H5R6S3_9EUKA|eukprot:CRZ09820.1 hypothetical protein [Spongospora subterranea]
MGAQPNTALTDVATRLQELAAHNVAVQRSLQVGPAVDVGSSPREHLEQGMSLARSIALSLKGASSSVAPEVRRIHDKLKKTLERELKKAHSLAEQLAAHERMALQESKRRNNQIYQGQYQEQESQFATESREPLLQDQVQIDMAAEQARHIEETEQEIRQIERDVTELNDMFKDMGMLVEQQQENIDCIEDNIASTATYTRSGYEQVQTAARYQRRARSRLCKLLFLLATIVVIAGYFLFHN